MKYNKKIMVMLSRLAARRVSASQQLNKAEAQNKNAFRATRCVGFTLIELLVVVLIIGILSAIALPQYQKAVEKSKAVKIISLLKSMGQAAQEYYLANGAYPTKFADLSVSLPADFSEHETWWEGGSAITDTLSNGEWSFQLENTVWGNPAIYVGRLRGAYAGGGFGYRFGPNNATHEEISCSEHKSKYKKASGSYCVGLFGGQQIAGLDGWFNRAYRMP